MYLQTFVSALINLSEIRARTLPYYDDIQVICAIISALAVLATFVHFLYNRIHKSKISNDTKIPVDNKKYSTDSEEIKKETANQNTSRYYNPSTLPEYSEGLKQFVTENRSDELRKALTYLEKKKFYLLVALEVWENLHLREHLWIADLQIYQNLSGLISAQTRV